MPRCSEDHPARLASPSRDVGDELRFPSYAAREQVKHVAPASRTPETHENPAKTPARRRRAPPAAGPRPLGVISHREDPGLGGTSDATWGQNTCRGSPERASGPTEPGLATQRGLPPDTAPGFRAPGRQPAGPPASGSGGWARSATLQGPQCQGAGTERLQHRPQGPQFIVIWKNRTSRCPCTSCWRPTRFLKRADEGRESNARPVSSRRHSSGSQGCWLGLVLSSGMV